MAVAREREMDDIFNVINIINRDSLIGNHFGTALFHMMIEQCRPNAKHARTSYRIVNATDRKLISKR